MPVIYTSPAEAILGAGKSMGQIDAERENYRRGVEEARLKMHQQNIEQQRIERELIRREREERDISAKRAAEAERERKEEEFAATQAWQEEKLAKEQTFEAKLATMKNILDAAKLGEAQKANILKEMVADETRRREERKMTLREAEFERGARPTPAEERGAERWAATKLEKTAKRAYATFDRRWGMTEEGRSRKLRRDELKGAESSIARVNRFLEREESTMRYKLEGNYIVATYTEQEKKPTTPTAAPTDPIAIRIQQARAKGITDAQIRTDLIAKGLNPAKYGL